MIELLPQFSENVLVTFLTKHDNQSVPAPRVRLHQVHGNRTIVARSPSETTEQADGVITDVAGLSLMARAADCQNFAIYAPQRRVGGVVHVGWRGVLCGALPGFFEVLHTEFGITPEETVVAAGPSLCQHCAEYADPTHQLRRSIDARYVYGDCVDLRAAADEQLQDLGVPAERYSRHPDCTRCAPKTYLTYRGGDKSAVESGESNILVLTIQTPK